MLSGISEACSWIEDITTIFLRLYCDKNGTCDTEKIYDGLLKNGISLHGHLYNLSQMSLDWSYTICLKFFKILDFY